MARSAIITGSDSGIGKVSAVALAEAGCDVGITWHTDEEGAEGAAQEVRAAGRRAEVRRLDLLDLPAAVAVIDDLADSQRVAGHHQPAGHDPPDRHRPQGLLPRRAHPSGGQPGVHRRAQQVDHD